ncbi:MAG: membrane protein insertase YidC [Ilumatobacteraceae bacterium]|nr:MAG: membrane protein insertase YidC [Actinomycetota bacterium]
MFQAAAWLISQFYELTNNYAVAIALVAVVIMVLLTPLTLKSTKGMLEMQRLQPEMRRLQTQYRGDRQKLNEEMMKLYQEHKVNPLASCLPLLAQMPIFIVMFRVIHGLTTLNADGTRFDPRYISKSSSLYRDLVSADPPEMLAFGLDLARRPFEVMRDDPFPQGVIYGLLVVLLAALYFVQQRMIASRTTSATMSPAQQKLMQYLPVFFAVFQLFFPVGLVIYYVSQTVVRILQQAYITRRFYHGDHSLGRQAQAASAHARELAKKDGGGGGLLGQMKQDPAAPKSDKADRRQPNAPATGSAPAASKRTTPPKNRPTPAKNRPTPPSRPGTGSSRAHPSPPGKKQK